MLAAFARIDIRVDQTHLRSLLNERAIGGIKDRRMAGGEDLAAVKAAPATILRRRIFNVRSCRLGEVYARRAALLQTRRKRQAEQPSPSCRLTPMV